MSGTLGTGDQADRDRLFELSLDMLCVAGFDGYFKQVNPAWSRTLGWSQAELLAFSWKDLVHADDRRASWEAGQQLFAGKPSVFFENRHRCKDGSYRWLSWNAYPVVADKTIFAVVRDITEQKKMEEAKAQLELRLRESQKLEALGTLAGGIAHDFNNILGAILGNAALARDEMVPGSAAAACLDEIRRASLRARDLVQQILTFSRHEPQRLVTQPLQPIIEETHKLLRATLSARVRLEVSLDDGPHHVHADATQIQQVLMNLCTNAWHALKDGAGLISIGLEPAALDETDCRRLAGLRAGPHVHLWVRDDGVGMDAATRDRIFEPFFTTKPVGQGTGLGLSVVHGIVTAHHGAIAVDTEPGRGTTFHLYVPVVEAGSRAPAAGPASAQPVSGRGERVLYVDDDETMVLMVERLLQRAGYQSHVCLSAQEAIQAVRAQPEWFDLVVTDYNMPGLSGLQVARALAELRPSLPVVLSSGYIGEELRTEARRLGVRALLEKQNLFEDLCPLVGQLLAHGGGSTGP
jgi:PAS domain S-box-containing protein